MTNEVHHHARQNINTVVNYVRLFLRDQPKLNKLTKMKENDDDEIRLAVHMAISDWNGTPPLLNPVGIEDFPLFDWLIVASAMFVLQSSGVLQHRNDLPFNDNGVSVNPWSKGPAYVNLAGMWAQMCETKKRDFKYAYNVGKTFGIIKSPEYRMWDYSGLYAGAQFNDFGTGSLSAAPSMVPDMANGQPYPPTWKGHDAPPLNFRIADWIANPLTTHYEITFNHALNTDVDVRITDPATGNDLRSRCMIRFASKNMVVIAIPLTPDTRFDGQMIAFRI